MNISCSLQIQVGNYTLPSLSQCAQKIYKPLSRFKENFTIEKVKSLFEHKTREVKSSDGLYYTVEDPSIIEMIIASVCAVAATTTLISLAAIGLGVKIALLCFIGTALFLSFIALVIGLVCKLIDIFIGSKESEKPHNPLTLVV